MNTTLHYLHDPMCSWCWGYRPVWEALQHLISEKHSDLTINYVVGGLAPDNLEPMPAEMQQAIQAHWRRINAELGTAFNYDFWGDNTPRRSTYPACRAVLTAKRFGLEKAMIESIQRAYYLNALNPSNEAVLVQLASSLLDDKAIQQFTTDMNSEGIEGELQRHLSFTKQLHQLGVANGFPSLVLEANECFYKIPVDYKDETATFSQINSILATL